MASIMKKEECCVCTEDVTRSLGTCCHYVHRKCVLLSGKDSCPLCKVRIATMTRSERETLNKAKRSLSAYNRTNAEQLVRDAINEGEDDDDSTELDFMDHIPLSMFASMLSRLSPGFDNPGTFRITTTITIPQWSDEEKDDEDEDSTGDSNTTQ